MHGTTTVTETTVEITEDSLVQESYARPERDNRRHYSRRNSDNERYRAHKTYYRQTDRENARYRQKDYDREEERRPNPRYNSKPKGQHTDRYEDYQYNNQTDRRDSRRYSYRYNDRNFPPLNDSDSDNDEVFHRSNRNRQYYRQN